VTDSFIGEVPPEVPEGVDVAQWDLGWLLWGLHMVVMASVESIRGKKIGPGEVYVTGSTKIVIVSWGKAKDSKIGVALTHHPDYTGRESLALWSAFIDHLRSCPETEVMGKVQSLPLGRWLAATCNACGKQGKPGALIDWNREKEHLGN